MSYFGRAFVFDSVPCEEYDLMLYDVGGVDDNDIDVPSVGEVVDETVGDKWKPYFFGVKPAAKLEFDIVFGVNEDRIDNYKYLDRYEVAAVAAWLTGHKEYKWLFIDQPDMRPFGYRCLIKDLDVTQYGKVPWALKAHVICDSPYAYLEEMQTNIEVNGATELEFYNASSLNDFYYPVITFHRTGGTAFSITNEQDSNRGPAFTDVPASVSSMTIDNEHGVITNNADLNLYEKFNFQFLRLARGYNKLTITGTGTLDIMCEFPVNVGG